MVQLLLHLTNGSSFHSPEALIKSLPIDYRSIFTINNSIWFIHKRDILHNILFVQMAADYSIELKTGN